MKKAADSQRPAAQDSDEQVTHEIQDDAVIATALKWSLVVFVLLAISAGAAAWP